MDCYVILCQTKKCHNKATHYIGKWVCDIHFNKHYEKKREL